MTTTVFPPLCFNYIMPNLRRRVGPATPPATESEIPTRGRIRPSRSLCRNLFGTLDHEESMKFVKLEQNRLAEADSRRWNFDFVNEKPLEGKIKWQVTDTSKVPPAYNMPNLTAKITNASASTSSSQSTDEAAVSKKSEETTPSDKTIAPIEPANITTTTTTHIIKPVARRVVVTASENNTKTIVKAKSVKRKRSSQTRITDYLRSCKRQRSGESKSEEESARPPVLKRAKTSS